MTAVGRGVASGLPDDVALVLNHSNRVDHRAKAAGAIDCKPWGRVRRLPSGAMQMFVRDPAGNLVEIASARDAVIDPALFADELVEPKPGMYRMAPGAAVGAHETP